MTDIESVGKVEPTECIRKSTADKLDAWFRSRDIIDFMPSNEISSVTTNINILDLVLVDQSCQNDDTESVAKGK